VKANLALFSVGVLGLALVASSASATLYDFKYTGNTTRDAAGTAITSGRGAFTFETSRGMTTLTGPTNDRAGLISVNAFPIDASEGILLQGTSDTASYFNIFSPTGQSLGVGTHDAWASALDGSSVYSVGSLGSPDVCNDCVADGSMTITSAEGLPDVSTWAMMLLGFAGLGFAGHRKTTRNWAVAA